MNKNSECNKKNKKKREKSTEVSGDDLRRCEKERDEYLDGWKRSRADFSNYKKESIERSERIANYREEVIILEILNIVDNFRDAERVVPQDKIDNIIDGFLKIKNNLDDLLKKMEVEEIESVGKIFNPNLHEAIEMIDGKGESGSIIEEVSRGYMRKGRLLRAAKVRVLK
ncbi:MAG: nucleotide exchange factor GrpE [Candidatus Pacebacteria bacterium]|nr:nucleotide exchange factor GrpE [Candidatus Paceibacterota bacterium]